MKKYVMLFFLCCIIFLISACGSPKLSVDDLDETQEVTSQTGESSEPKSTSAQETSANTPDSSHLAEASSSTSGAGKNTKAPASPSVTKAGTKTQSAASPTKQKIPDTVLFSKNGGIYNEPFALSLSAPDGYEIYYTVDGSDPCTNGKKYAGSIDIEPSTPHGVGALTSSVAQTFKYIAPTHQLVGTVIKAYAKKGSVKSPVYTNSYFVASGLAEKYNLPYVSISLPGTDFATETGIYVSVMNAPFEKKERKVAYFELFDRKGVRQAGQFVELSMSGHGSLGHLQKSMRLYFKKSANPDVADNPGKLKYDIFGGRAKDSAGKSITSFDRLMLRNSGNDCTATMLRDAVIHRLCAPLKCDYMESQPAMCFVNGEFWGLYNIRERYDKKYFSAHYGIKEENVVLIEAPSPLVTNNTNSPYELCDGTPGDEKPFNELVDFIRKNNLSQKSNYEYVESLIDFDSFIDYYIANVFFDNPDWPGNNAKVWKNKDKNDPSGFDTKWHFAIVDLDMGLGLAGSYDHDMMISVNSGTVVGDMMGKLLANKDFQFRFIERFTELTNSVFTPEKTLPVMEAYAEEIKAAESLNVNRWCAAGNTVAKWKSEISKVRTFLEKRPEYALRFLKNYFGGK